MECLVSDFAGNMDAVHTVATSPLDVYAHNLETVSADVCTMHALSEQIAADLTFLKLLMSR